MSTQPSEFVRESPKRALLVALAVALTCGTLVSITSVLLEPRRAAHRERERQQVIAGILQHLPGVAEIMETTGARDVTVRLVDLATGEYDDSLDPRTFDPAAAAEDPEQSVAIPREDDLAKIGRRATRARVYTFEDDDRLRLIVLPVHGAGYVSTLRGYLALEGDGNTVVALSFTEQEETPGLGAVVGEPAWRDRWAGKRLRDERGELRLGVARHPLPPGSPDAPYQVDAITGATRTGRGVTNLLRFWLGENGYGPYLERIRAAQGAS